MEPIRVRRSLRCDRVRHIRACNSRSAYAAIADPSFDAARENLFACLSHLCARAKLDLFAAALAQLLVREWVRCPRAEPQRGVPTTAEIIFFVHFARFVVQLLALCESS